MTICSVCIGEGPNCDMIWVDEALHKQALGRLGALGELYDAHTDTLTKLKMLKDEVPPCAVRSLGLDERSDTLQVQFFGPEEVSYGQQLETLRKLNVDGDMALSLMLGLVESEGCAKSLIEMNPNRETSCAFAFTILTEEETLLLNHDDLRALVVPDMLKTSDATHVVVGIKWGRSGVLVFKNEHDDECIADMKDGMDCVARLLLRSLTGVLPLPSLPYMFMDVWDERLKPTKALKRTSVKLVGDVRSNRRVRDLPSAIDFAHNFGMNLNYYCDVGTGFDRTKGRPLEFTLLSVHSLAKMYQIEGMRGCMMKPLSQTTRWTIEQELVDLADERRALSLLQDEMLKCGHNFHAEEVVMVASALAAAERAEQNFHTDMRKCLLEVRSGNIFENAIQSAIDAFGRSNYNDISSPGRAKRMRLKMLHKLVSSIPASIAS